jgi:putative SOS response-associated peptidase YedK
MLALFGAEHDRTGTPPPHYAVMLGDAVPVVRNDADGGRSIELMRWGLPDQQGGGNRCATILDVADPRWRDWLAVEHRCVIPVNAFSVRAEGGERHWFARDDSRAPFAFAGIWLPAVAEDKGLPLFAILMTKSNAPIRAIGSDDMPVILAEGDWDEWLEGDADAALALPRSTPDDLLTLVATGEDRDPPESRMGYQ